jgi:thiol-disulfide isomerase/thioredoxin
MFKRSGKTVVFSIVLSITILLALAFGAENEKSKASNPSVTVKAEKEEGLSVGGGSVLSGLNMSYELKKILDNDVYWQLVAKGSYGQTIPDCNLTDINGKVHKLSNYQGKNVLVFSWAVWCPGCKAQIYFLNKLKKEYPADKLEILAIAAKTNRDNPEMLKKFVEKNEMKYPIFYMDPNDVPMPFNLNMFVPCTYFVTPQRSLKVGLEEIVVTRELKRIIEAP